ncbi:dienelactone hydrolase family protein [Nocardia sp. NPDC051463]|uniref:dienelactone hydrolase family protein n=1 Tax=Nocardia sp. NPDC051463 TaxID=3154845 RepID=UPI00343406A6
MTEVITVVQRTPMTLPVVFDTFDIAAADGDADSYLVRPDDGRTHPGLLLLMDAFGLRPWLREMMETIAAHGFTVLAPNIFYRSGRAPLLPLPNPAEPDGQTNFFAALAPVRQQLTPDNTMADVKTYLDRLSACQFVAPGALAVTGYCMGGRLALRTAGAYGSRIAAAASFHGGRLAVEDAPDSPHHAANDITAELLIAHADRDVSMPADQITLLDSALDVAGVRFTSAVYRDARHGFTMRDTPAFSEAAYERHLHALLALLDRTFANGTA